MLALCCAFSFPLQAQVAPSAYTAYTGTDTRPIPAPPALGAANTVITDPTFGSRILRVTDEDTKGGESFIPTDSGFHRTFNADSTAIKLTGPHGDGYWMAFNPSSFTVGDGSPKPAIHSLPFGSSWEWSVVNPNYIYYLNGSQIARYDKSTGASTNIGGTPNGDPVAYMAVVVGKDNWVCAAAGPGIQDSYTEILCVDPANASNNKFIDVYNRTVNGVAQSDPNWPTSAAGQVIGIHDISGGTGASWLELTFHQQSWGADGGAVLDLSKNTWSMVTSADQYWSGHVSMGNGKYANAGGSISGSDSRGFVIRNPNDLMNISEFLFVGQPPDNSNGWCDADHSSWLNSGSNPNAPILFSRYTPSGACNYAWSGEIDAAAVDGTNTVWRFAHTHNEGANCYYAEGFAQISNDGKWALFSSYWGGTLGSDTAFGCSNRIDTFIVDLTGASGTSGSSGGSTGSTTGSTGSGSTGSTAGSTGSGSTGSTTGSTAASGTIAAGTTLVQETSPAITYSGSWFATSNGALNGGGAKMAMDAGSTATITFAGTGVEWVGYKDAWSGNAQVYVDGALKGTVNAYAPTDTPQIAVYAINGLMQATHKLEISVTGTNDADSGGSWIWVDGFNITSGTPATSASAPAITVASVANAASYTSAIAPASIGTIFGSNLATSSAAASVLPLPGTVGGATLRVNGIVAPLYYASPTQLNFQWPRELAGQSQASLTVTVNGQTGAAKTVTVSSYAPGIFTTNQQGTGQGLVEIANTAILAAPVGITSTSRAVKRGEYVSIYCSGLGATTNTPANGAPSPSNPLAYTSVQPTVTIGGVAAAVTYSGLAPGYVGVYQVNVHVPASAPVGNAVPLALAIAGAQANAVTIAVQ